MASAIAESEFWCITVIECASLSASAVALRAESGLRGSFTERRSSSWFTWWSTERWRLGS